MNEYVDPLLQEQKRLRQLETLVKLLADTNPEDVADGFDAEAKQIRAILCLDGPCPTCGRKG
jgi:hypothetical protein